jgi:hypothetical protein
MSSSVRCLRAGVPVVLLLAGILGLSYPAHASGLASQAGGGAPDGSNLLVNARGTGGAASAQGWDAVTIPGWQVAAGLPTVVRYGTAGFPRRPGAVERLMRKLGIAGARAARQQPLRSDLMLSASHSGRWKTDAPAMSHFPGEAGCVQPAAAPEGIHGDRPDDRAAGLPGKGEMQCERRADLPRAHRHGLLYLHQHRSHRSAARQRGVRLQKQSIVMASRSS